MKRHSMFSMVSFRFITTTFDTLYIYIYIYGYRQMDIYHSNTMILFPVFNQIHVDSFIASPSQTLQVYRIFNMDYYTCTWMSIDMDANS